MKIIIIGSGISGLSAAIRLAEKGARVTMISPFCSERSQSVMAAGGINAVLDVGDPADSVEAHAEDTWRGGCCLESRRDILTLCQKAPEYIRRLEEMGVAFQRDGEGRVCTRAFGGQSHSRTVYAGASTGKQIVTAMNQKCREYEILGSVRRVTGPVFHSALIDRGTCRGVLTMDPLTGDLRAFYGDAVIMAVGGQNKLFGKTTGTETCDGYAAGRLFSQGVRLRNLEFIQYHPTTIETSHKKMLISEAARGEGGRLYYLRGGERVYFMEERYGKKGNLMPRDIVSKCIWDCPSQVYLDVTFLGEERIRARLGEVWELCRDYLDLDITKESIPISPAVHFFMGGIDVDARHETNLRRLYAVGECASRYHGANRLGGNSLLAAIHSGTTAAEAALARGPLAGSDKEGQAIFDGYIRRQEEEIRQLKASQSEYPAVYILREIASVMNSSLGITRDEKGLDNGIRDIRFFREALNKLRLDPEVSLYENLRLRYMALLALAILQSAKERRESRGAHIRSDHPETRETMKKCSLAVYDKQEDRITVSFFDEETRDTREEGDGG